MVEIDEIHIFENDEIDDSHVQKQLERHDVDETDEVHIIEIDENDDVLIDVYHEVDDVQCTEIDEIDEMVYLHAFAAVKIINDEIVYFEYDDAELLDEIDQIDEVQYLTNHVEVHELLDDEYIDYDYLQIILKITELYIEGDEIHDMLFEVVVLINEQIEPKYI